MRHAVQSPRHADNLSALSDQPNFTAHNGTKNPKRTTQEKNSPRLHISPVRFLEGSTSAYCPSTQSLHTTGATIQKGKTTWWRRYGFCKGGIEYAVDRSNYFILWQRSSKRGKKSGKLSKSACKSPLVFLQRGIYSRLKASLIEAVWHINLIQDSRSRTASTALRNSHNALR